MDFIDKSCLVITQQSWGGRCDDFLESWMIVVIMFMMIFGFIQKTKDYQGCKWGCLLHKRNVFLEILREFLEKEKIIAIQEKIGLVMI